MISRIKELNERYEKEISIGFFAGGFIFDIFTLGRIDDWFNIIQQGIYLVLLTTLVILDFLYERSKLNIPGRLKTLWSFREFAIHFIFGSLLSVYTLFYLKSASLLTSFVFMIFLISLLILNEFPFFQKRGPIVRFALLSLCYTSYFAYLIPILMKYLGVMSFALAQLLSLGISVGVHYLLKKKFEKESEIRATSIGAPLFVQISFLIMYLFGSIPPVPLSLEYVGVYRSVQKTTEGHYQLTYYRPWWRFWQNGDQTFEARSGDPLVLFAQIFSPGGFRDTVYIHWLFKQPRRGWISADRLPMNISGGRSEGFRGIMTKQNYEPGDWRVQVETRDGREIGRIYLSIKSDDSVDIREPKIDLR